MYIYPASLLWNDKLLEVKPITCERIGKKSIFLWMFFLCLLSLFDCRRENKNFLKEDSSLSLFDRKREYLWIDPNKNINSPEILPTEGWQEFSKSTLGFETESDQDLWLRFSDRGLNTFKNPVLFFEIGLEYLDVYHGNKLVYRFQERDYVFPHIIPVENESKGYIYILCKSSYKGFIGVDKGLKFQEHSEALVHLFLENAARSFLSPVLIVLSFIFLGLYFLRRQERLYLYFSALLFSCAIIEAMNGFIGFSLKSYSYLTIPLMYVNLTLCPVLLLIFLREIFPLFFKKIFQILIIIHLFVYLQSAIHNWNKGISFLNNEWDYSWWVIVEGIIAILASAYVLIKGETKLKLITYGLLAVIVTGCHDTLVDMEILPYQYKLIHIGFWAMICQFGYFVFNYYWNVLKSVDTYNQELQKKNKDLERLIAIDKDLILAKELQRSLLSDLHKEDEQIRLIAFSQSLHSIGGDYFDHNKDSLGNWAVLMADVAGHGISSAVVAAMTKMAFAGTSAYLQFPSRVFNSMNRHLAGKTKGLFITASYLFIDTEASTLSYANAGHPGFYILRKSSPRLLEYKAKGRPLGIFSDMAYSEEKISLEEGDKIFLYTDGVLDLSDDHKSNFGEEKLKQLLWENKHQSIKSLRSIVQDSLASFSRSWKFQDDDVSFLVIEYKHSSLIQDSE